MADKIQISWTLNKDFLTTYPAANKKLKISKDGNLYLLALGFNIDPAEFPEKKAPGQYDVYIHDISKLACIIDDAGVDEAPEVVSVVGQVDLVEKA